MGAIMSGDATPAQVGALLVGLTMKGERPQEIVGLAKTMRANAVQLSQTFDTCSTRAAPAATGRAPSIFRPRRHSWPRPRACASRSTATVGLEPVRECRRVRGARGQYRCGTRCRRRVARHSRDRVLLCADLPPLDASRRPRQTGARRSYRLDLLRPLTYPAAARRQLVGVPHSELTELLARP